MCFWDQEGEKGERYRVGSSFLLILFHYTLVEEGSWCGLYYYTYSGFILITEHSKACEQCGIILLPITPVLRLSSWKLQTSNGQRLFRSHSNNLVGGQWGAVEQGVEQYKWSGYHELFEKIRSYNLKVQAVMSFHACGGNVGDDVSIELPRFVDEVSSFTSGGWRQ